MRQRLCAGSAPCWCSGIAVPAVPWGPIAPGDLPAAIQLEDLRPPARTEDKTDPGAGKTLNEIAKETVLECVSRHHGNLIQAAKELGISRTTLWRRPKEYKEAGFRPEA